MKTICYKNLVTKKWSLKQADPVTGKPVVVGHADEVGMLYPEAHVGGAHDRVRAAHTREVFAWIVGDLHMVKGFVPFKGREVVLVDEPVTYGWSDDDLSEVTFHPFSEEKRGFFWVDMGDDFDYAYRAYFGADKKMWCYV